MLRIPFYKPSIGAEEINEVVDTLKSGWLTTGPKTKQFEREFADYLKHRHAIAVNSCTAALHLALEAIGLKAGQGVIVPTMTFAATAEVVRYFGARPILADCRAEDFNLDVADADRKVQSALAAGQSVAAIMPVHYGGQIGDVAGVRSLARRHNLKIVEDAAHCCPAYYKDNGKKAEDGRQKIEDSGQWSVVSGQWSADRGPISNLPSPISHLPSTINHQPSTINHATPYINPQPSTLNLLNNGWLPVGSSADISCYSFYANKTITTGEGGMACTANDEYADRMRIMSLHGISRDAWKRYTTEGSWYYEIIAPGFKYNMADIAAAIGLQQLRKADEALLNLLNLPTLKDLLLTRIRQGKFELPVKVLLQWQFDGSSFDFDEDVAVLPIAAVEKLMGDAGFAPDRVSRLLVRFANAAVIERHLVAALRQRHDEIGQQVLMPRLALVRIELHAPHAQMLVLEQNLVADRSKLARLRHRVPPYLPTIFP